MQNVYVFEPENEPKNDENATDFASKNAHDFAYKNRVDPWFVVAVVVGLIALVAEVAKRL